MPWAARWVGVNSYEIFVRNTPFGFGPAIFNSGSRDKLNWKYGFGFINTSGKLRRLAS